jgi:DNA-binding MarR family transcriptional regulator
VARWRDHWVDLDFDPEVEAITVRIGRIVRYLRQTTEAALAEVGIGRAEYDTLHLLMIRDTPGRANPTRLAEDLGLSNAGMTGRIDALERAGWVQRSPSPDDRRRVDLEVTRAGVKVWRAAMELRGRAEDELFGLLAAGERTALATALKRLTLAIDDQVPEKVPEKRS